MRSMPTNETRTHASMTIPLSSTRSRTSIRLVPPAARSTAIVKLLTRQLVCVGGSRRTSVSTIHSSRRNERARHHLTQASSGLIPKVRSFSSRPKRARATAGRLCQRRQPALEQAQLLAEFQVFLHDLLAARRQVPVVLPPIKTDGFRLVDRADHQANPDRQQLDFGQRNLDVPCYHQPLVEDAVENVDEPGVSTARA